MRVDAHQHFWRIARGDYGWLTQQDHPSIYRDYIPGDLQPLLARARIDRTVLVQAAPSLSETDFLLDVAARTPFVAGVVGWIDFEAADAVDTIRRLTANQKLVGLRPMMQGIANARWMLSPRLNSALSAMSEAGLAFDALVQPRHLPVLHEFLAQNPELRVVIDHAAKPDIASGELGSWASAMRDLARATTAHCKLSGLVTEAGRDWSAETLRPFVDVLLETFGPSRLMWGSDWPVLNEASDYLTWLSTAEFVTKSLPVESRAALFGGSAQKFYGLTE